MNKPHVHAEVIKAWADGKQVQCYDLITRSWECVEHPSWRQHYSYRVKPETIRYRVALLKANRRYRTYAPTDENGEQVMANSASFVRWLTDWIEAEV